MKVCLDLCVCVGGVMKNRVERKEARTGHQPRRDAAPD